MSKSYKNESCGTNKPDYIEDLTVRDMPSSYAKSDGLNVQTQEDIDEGWIEKKPSSLTGGISGAMEELEQIPSELTASDEVRECVNDSADCYQICTETILRCLTAGGKHAKPEHINLLLDCAKICNINADFMLRNSTYYPQTCGICADICDECSDVCERFEDDFMQECASVCRRCAESCREMTR